MLNVPFIVKVLVGIYLQIYLFFILFTIKKRGISHRLVVVAPHRQSHSWVAHLQINVRSFCSQFVLRDIRARSSFSVSGGRQQTCGGSMFWVNLLTLRHLYQIYQMCQNRVEEEQRELSCLPWLRIVEHVYLIFLLLSCLAGNARQMCWSLQWSFA